MDDIENMQKQKMTMKNSNNNSSGNKENNKWYIAVAAIIIIISLLAFMILRPSSEEKEPNELETILTTLNWSYEQEIELCVNDFSSPEYKAILHDDPNQCLSVHDYYECIDYALIYIALKHQDPQICENNIEEDKKEICKAIANNDDSLCNSIPEEYEAAACRGSINNDILQCEALSGDSKSWCLESYLLAQALKNSDKTICSEHSDFEFVAFCEALIEDEPESYYDAMREDCKERKSEDEFNARILQAWEEGTD